MDDARLQLAGQPRQVGISWLRRLSIVEAQDREGRAAQLLRALVDSAVNGIIVIDARGLIEMFNPAAERLFGYRQEDVIGRNVTVTTVTIQLPLAVRRRP
jgi:PAS domain-containing protein